MYSPEYYLYVSGVFFLRAGDILKKYYDTARPASFRMSFW